MRNPRQDFSQGVRTAGRSADDYDFDSRLGSRPIFYRWMTPWKRQEFQWNKDAAERFDLGDKFRVYALDGNRGAAGIAGLCGVVRRSQRKRVEGGCRPALGKRAEHNDWQLGIQLAQRPKRLQAVHYRHFDIQRNQVGLQQWNLGQSDSSVAGHAYYFQ